MTTQSEIRLGLSREFIAALDRGEKVFSTRVLGLSSFKIVAAHDLAAAESVAKAYWSSYGYTDGIVRMRALNSADIHRLLAPLDEPQAQ